MNIAKERDLIFIWVTENVDNSDVFEIYNRQDYNAGLRRLLGRAAFKNGEMVVTMQASNLIASNYY